MRDGKRERRGGEDKRHQKVNIKNGRKPFVDSCRAFRMLLCGRGRAGVKQQGRRGTHARREEGAFVQWLHITARMRLAEGDKLEGKERSTNYGHDIYKHGRSN